jgi:hypothetical protein
VVSHYREDCNCADAVECRAIASAERVPAASADAFGSPLNLVLN